MFREMRRKRQLLTEEESVLILQRMTSGVLALAGDDGYPYAVPISYVYHEKKIFFHSAMTGHKIDAIARCDKVSFCVIAQDDIVPDEYTTYFKSVIAFGRIRIVGDEEEKRDAIELLAAKYSPEDAEGRAHEIEKGFNHMHIIELSIEHLTGKEAIELVRARKASSKES
jgi:nitroimidazol reductase NimA-like FMN-containing flavoprotein (pyridoxamine 5'-phosphate oxidase superfamily)